MQIGACNFLSHIVVPCLELFRDICQTVRRTRAAVWKKECLEWKEKFRSAELRIQTLQEKLATAQAGKALMAAAAVWSVILPKPIAFPLDLLALGTAFSDELLTLVTSLRESASKVTRRMRPVRLIKQIRSGMLDWKWKAAPISGTFSTSH